MPLAAENWFLNVDDCVAVPDVATLMPEENACISNAAIELPIADSNFIVFARGKQAFEIEVVGLVVLAFVGRYVGDVMVICDGAAVGDLLTGVDVNDDTINRSLYVSLL